MLVLATTGETAEDAAQAAEVIASQLTRFGFEPHLGAELAPKA